MRVRVLWAAVTLAASAAITPCYAQAARTFVSSNGNDSNDCSRQAPCRSFATAITKTAAGGEINTLDPGGYGALTITKSISIVSGLGEAGVLVPAGGVGVTINAGPTDQINLRGLAIEGAGAGKTGILFKTGGALTVTNAVVRNVTEHAIDIEPTGTSYVTITDTLTSDNGAAGIYLGPNGGRADGVLSRITTSNNSWGVYANSFAHGTNTSPVNVTVTDSVVSANTKNSGIGIALEGPASTFLINLNVLHSTVYGNKYSIVNNGGFIEVSDVYTNSGISCRDGYYVRTYSNNVLHGSCLLTLTFN